MPGHRPHFLYDQIKYLLTSRPFVCVLSHLRSPPGCMKQHHVAHVPMRLATPGMIETGLLGSGSLVTQTCKPHLMPYWTLLTPC